MAARPGSGLPPPARDVRVVALVASAAGYSLTQSVIGRFGRPGAALVAGVTLALAVRDVGLIVAGTPSLLRRVPAALLWAEAGAAVAATTLTLPLALPSEPDGGPGAAPAAREQVRRLAVATLFGVHTVRFWIYLQPDQGRRGALPTGA